MVTVKDQEDRTRPSIQGYFAKAFNGVNVDPKPLAVQKKQSEKVEAKRSLNTAKDGLTRAVALMPIFGAQAYKGHKLVFEDICRSRPQLSYSVKEASMHKRDKCYRLRVMLKVVDSNSLKLVYTSWCNFSAHDPTHQRADNMLCEKFPWGTAGGARGG